MYKFKKIMIALDLTAMDQYILNYIEGLSKFIKAEKIYFINIQKNFDLDEDTKDIMGIGKDIPLDEFIQKSMNETVSKFFPSFGSFDCEYEIAEGNPSTEIIRWAKIKNSDLVLMGVKKDLKGEGVAPQQIASKINCSILLIPEGYNAFKLDSVFVPINFSEQTKLALEEAIDLQVKTPQRLHIFCHHFYELPLGHEKSGKTDEDFARILDQNSSKKWIKMRHDVGLETAEFNYTDELLKDGNIAKELIKKAQEYETDLIIMATKSKTLAAQLFLSNTLKKMIINTFSIPLLIVKDKNSTFDFWDFFSKM